MEKSFFKQVIVQSLFNLAIIVGLGVALNFVFAAWSEPTALPPAGNVEAPINVGAATQYKSGALGVGGLLAAYGNVEVSGTVKISGGSPAAGKVLTSDAFGLASWQTAMSSGSVPAGAVMYFNLSSCPSGWSKYSNAWGRYIVGIGSGTGLNSVVGISLSNGENRPAGAHTHKLNAAIVSGTSDRGGEMNAPIPATITTDEGASASGAALKAGTNAPYVQLLVCTKV